MEWTQAIVGGDLPFEALVSSLFLGGSLLLTSQSGCVTTKERAAQKER